MARVHIDSLTEGMVLKRNVCDRSGRLLLAKGDALTEKHFRILKMWGVLEVETTDDEEPTAELPEGELLDPIRLAQAQQRMQHLFVHNDPQHPAIKALMRICAQREASHVP